MTDTNKIIIPPMPVVSTATKNDVCPVCKGTGWELYRPSAFLLEYVYGGEDLAGDYARECTKCNGRPIEDHSQVPSLYRDADIYKFKFDIYQKDMGKIKSIVFSFFNDFEKWQGKGLYLYSKTAGSGKTFLACCLGKSIMMRTNSRLKFITAPDYINMVGQSYKRERGEADPTQIYRECELLILDDIGAHKPGEWQDQELFRLIDTRLSNGKTTIYTSNYSVSDLKIEERTKSRIFKSSIPIRLPEESIRDQMAAKEQNEFIERILGNGKR